MQGQEDLQVAEQPTTCFTGEAAMLISPFITQIAHFLIRQQKYLECLESRRSDAALHILRNELAPLSFDSDRLHLLSR